LSGCILSTEDWGLEDLRMEGGYRWAMAHFF